jgi:hypothetical protein
MKQIVKIEEITEPDDFVIYSDTDSAFVLAEPMIKAMMPDVDIKNDSQMTEAIMVVTGEVQKYVNNFYDIMASNIFNLTERRFGEKTHTFDAKQEVISKTSFWLAKKRYAQWIIHKEGALLDKPELEVKGIDMVRTSFPISFRAFMKLFLEKILTNCPQKQLDEIILDFKAKIPTLDVIELAKNTSVKFVSRSGTNYNPQDRRMFQIVAGSPAQVKASLAYNDLLKKWGLDEQYEGILNSQKIKWVYLQQNPHNVEAIAFKADGTDPKKIMEYAKTYIDRTAMFEHELRGKLADFYTTMKWVWPSECEKIARLFFDF